MEPVDNPNPGQAPGKDTPPAGNNPATNPSENPVGADSDKGGADLDALRRELAVSILTHPEG